MEMAMKVQGLDLEVVDADFVGEDNYDKMEDIGNIW